MRRGRAAPEASEIISLMEHRQRQLVALFAKARKDDELSRELAELDRDIASGVAALERRTARERSELAKALSERIEAADAQPG